MAHGKHKVSIHHWREGKLDIQTEIFDSLVEALGFVERIAAKVFRIHDEAGELISMNMPNDEDCERSYS